ncbi:MAG: preprotein translocase subunit YajC [Deltaproteobacteria bacterium]|nr:preprotein translocase subunit YajC [Deltaproteobacteria bacterium]
MLSHFSLGSTLISQAAPAGGEMSPIWGIVLMLAVFFFLIILPQSRKAKKHTNFIASLQKGDAVVTSSGLYGRIYGIADRIVTLEVAPNVRIRIDRQTIVSKDPTGGDEKAAA